MRKSLILALVFILVMSGCTGMQYGRTKEQAAAVADAHTGIKGVTVDFVKNSPPDIAYTGSPLDITIELKNEGAYDVKQGTLYLTGYDPRLFSISPRSKDFDLEGKSKFAYGGLDYISFSSQNVYLPQGAETLDQPFQASACYKYRTEARIPVCIDPDPSSILENEVCSATTTAIPIAGGQGAPITVSAVREDARPGQVGFQITISNQGGGVVVDQYSLSNCPTPLGFSDVDTVDYQVELADVPSGYSSCKPTGSIRMVNGQGTLYCTFSLADKTSPAYKSILAINLDYGYLTQKVKTIKIKSIE